MSANTDPNLLLWLGPYIALLVLMVFAMLEFTASLLAKAPVQRRALLPAADLAARLRALQTQLRPFEPVASAECDFELRWITGTQETARFLRGFGTFIVRLRILLDEERHELRINEASVGYGYRGGLFGWIPKLTASAGYAAGPPGITRSHARSWRRHTKAAGATALSCCRCWRRGAACALNAGSPHGLCAVCRLSGSGASYMPAAIAWLFSGSSW